MAIGSLLIRNTVSSLFAGFSSSMTIGRASLVNMTVPQSLLYLSNSNVSLSHLTLENIVLGEQGSLATVSSQSVLHLSSNWLSGISAYDHGLISLHRSSLYISDSVIAHLNVSFIIAQQSIVVLQNTDIFDIQLEGNLLLIPNGGLLSCIDCFNIELTSITCRDISGNKGGVIYAQSSNQTLNAVITIENSTFENCLARANGGAIQVENTSTTIVLSTFRGNSARYGGAAYFEGTSHHLLIVNSSFVRNAAEIAGSCVWWTGTTPTIASNSYINNSALYGNPQASTPHHFLLLSPETLQPITQFPLQGVTGQKMSEPFLVGVFDVLGQLIVSDNSTLVTAVLPSEIKALGSMQALTSKGVASFTFILSPFTTKTFNFTFSATSIVSFVFEYKFRDCQPGEARSESGCFPCSKNSYSLNPANSLCQMCPEHMQCRGRAELVLDEGYWRAHNLTDVIYPCPVLGSCLGGEASACASGYRGTLCNACAADYYRYASWQCRSCEHEIPEPVRGVMVAGFLIGVAAIPPKLSFPSQDAWYRTALAVRSFINYSQMVLFVSLLHAEWGFSSLVFNEIMRVIGSLGGLLIYSGCQDTDLSQYYFQMIVLSCYPGLLVTVCGLYWSIAKWRCSSGRKEVLMTIASASCAAIYTYLPVLALVVVTVYQCKEVEGNAWLVADMTEKCWRGEHLLYAIALATPLLLFMLCGYCFAVLCIIKPPLNQVCQQFHEYLTAESGEKMKHWEVYKLLRLLALASISLAYPKLQAFSSSILLICILGFSLQSDIKWSPYKSPILAKVNIASNLSVVLILFAVVDFAESVVTLLASLGTVAVILSGAVLFWKGNPYAVSKIKAVDDFAAVEFQEQPQMLENEESQDGLNPPNPSIQE